MKKLYALAALVSAIVQAAELTQYASLCYSCLQGNT